MITAVLVLLRALPLGSVHMDINVDGTDPGSLPPSVMQHVA